MSDQKQKTILVTGGGGYVGSHAIVKLLEENYQVVVVDNLKNCYKEDKLSQPESVIQAQALGGRRVSFYPVDITDEQALSQVFEKHKIDCVMHFAALKSVSESCQIPMTYYANNLNGAIVLTKVMERFNVRKLVYSSSSTVYGTPQFLPLTETHPTGQGCTNPYGKSKYMVEEMFKDLCASDPKWSVISLRYFNPVGAHETGKLGEDPSGTPNNLMPYVAQVAVGRLPLLYIYGDDYDTPDGTGVRDYIHIQDLVIGHIQALKMLYCMTIFKGGFKAYNLGTGTGYSVMEVVNMFSEVCGKKIPYKIVGRREGDIAESYCDISLAREDLNWTAKKTLRDMCADMWNWQIMNPEGYRKLKSKQ